MAAERRGPEPAPTSPTEAARARLAEAFASTRATEAWTRLAFVPLVLLLLVYSFLGLRLGGWASLGAWRYGRDLCFFPALLLLVAGTILSLRRRPFLQPGRMRAFVVLALVIGIAPLPFPYPSSHEGRTSAVSLRLPVSGTWRVFWGGDEKEGNRPAGYFAEQRWALALVREEEGRRWRSEVPAGPEDSLSFGEPVRAPAAGRVVSVRDGIPDEDLRRGRGDRPRAGNQVVLEVAPGQFLFATHLRSGSIAVAEGQRVAEGELLAAVGSSGSAPLVGEPHLALYLLDSPEEGAGEPIPWLLHDFFISDRWVEQGLPSGGMDRSGRLTGALVRRADSR